MVNLYGSDQLILKAGKLEAVELLRSGDLAKRVLGLERVVFEDPTINRLPTEQQIPEILSEIEEELAELVARRTVEDKIERKVAEKMRDRHEEYVRDLKLQLLKEEAGAENPQTEKKYADLEKLERRGFLKAPWRSCGPAVLRK